MNLNLLSEFAFVLIFAYQFRINEEFINDFRKNE